MFVGRERELSTLEDLYKQDRFQMVVMYGRRRIGKTTLISRFMENKPGIFFSAQEASDRYNLEEFSRHIYRFFEIPDSAGSFSSWNDAFRFLGEKAKDRQFVLAFDEFPYAAESNRALRSILQNAIDHIFKETHLYLILCGSQISFMETEVLGYKSPLFGRRTAQIQLESFDYMEAVRMLDGFSQEDIIRFYSCLGGIPLYLSLVRKDLSFEQNIKQLYFDISGYLYNEPMMLLRQELREPAMYNSIIGAIAGGASRLNEIATRLGEDSSKINKYLHTLSELRIVKKVYPFGEDKETSRKGIYRIYDNSYHFWYSFVFPNRQEIESGQGAFIADREVFGENLSAFIGKPAFEDICRAYLILQNRIGQLDFTATSFGSWWGNDPKSKSQSDVDVIAADRKTKRIILGECKWKNQAVDMADIQKLLDKEHLLAEYVHKSYYLFSKKAFSKSVRIFAEQRPDLHLVTLQDLFTQPAVQP